MTYFLESFTTYGCLLSIIALYHQIKTSIDFCCKWILNPKSLIQLSKILPVELIKTHLYGLFNSDITF